MPFVVVVPQRITPPVKGILPYPKLRFLTIHNPGWRKIVVLQYLVGHAVWVIRRLIAKLQRLARARQVGEFPGIDGILNLLVDDRLAFR